MKDLEEQIRFIDQTLLPLFGVGSVTDYGTVLFVGDLDRIPDLVTKLNAVLGDFRATFPVKDFSLHKTGYEIKTTTQAFNLLRKCLEITSIQCETGVKRKRRYLRLIPQNDILSKYIIAKSHKMSEIRTFPKNATPTVPEPDAEFPLGLVLRDCESLSDGSGDEHRVVPPGDEVARFYGPKYVFKNGDLLENIKMEHRGTFTVIPKYQLQGNVFVLSLKRGLCREARLRSLRLQFRPLRREGVDVISGAFLESHLAGTTYTFNVGDSQIYKGTFQNGKELMPEGVIFAVDSELLRFHDAVLRIDLGDRFRDVAPLVVVECEFSRVDFYAEFDAKLTENVRIDQRVHNEEGKVNCWTQTCGMMGVQFTEYVTPERFEAFTTRSKVPDPPLTPPPMEEAFAKHGVVGVDHYLDNVHEIKGFKCTTVPTGSANLIPLCYGYTFTLSNRGVFTVTSPEYYVTKEGGDGPNGDRYRHHLTLQPIRYGDTICDLRLVGGIPPDTTVKFRAYSDGPHVVDLHFERVAGAEHVFRAIEINDQHHLNIVGSPHRSDFELEYVTDSVEGFVEVRLDITFCDWATGPRRRMAQSGIPLIDVRDFVTHTS